MKKLFLLAAVAGTFFVACNGGSSEATNDSTATAAPAVDTVATAPVVDSVAAPVDSVAAPVDSVAAPKH